MKRRLALALLLLAGGTACGKNPGSGLPVPQSMNESVAQFLAAVKANDLKRMGELWGTERGPAAGSMDAQELQRRLTVIQKYLQNSGYRIIEGPLLVPGHDELRTYRVEFQRLSCDPALASRTPTMPRVQPIDIVHTRSGGWLVYDVHLESAGSPSRPCQPDATGGTKP